MSQDDLEFDSAVEWLSIEVPRQPGKPRRNTGAYWVIGAAAALVLLTVTVAAQRLYRWTTPIEVSVSAHGLGDSAALRAESVHAFENFDASVDPLAGLTAQQRQERESIASFLKQVAACSAQAGEQAGDDAAVTDLQAQAEEFAELVDYDRLAKRIEHTGRIDQYSNLSKRQLRAELRRSLTVEPYWAQITIASVHIPADDPDTRVVYAYTSDPTESDKSEVRFVLVRDADSWKLCDWERLDLGMHASEEWSIYAFYGDSPVIQGYVDWSQAIGEADRLMQANETEAAEEKIQLAETYTVPAEMHDLHWALTAYRWQALGDDNAARRCFERIGSPAEVPGAYYGLMNCYNDSDIPAALDYAEQYEQSVGPTPDLCVAKAGMFATMHRQDEALAEWKKLLRIEPKNQAGLRQILLALAEDDKAAIRPYLERLSDPVQALVELAENAGWDDPGSLQFLLAEVDRLAPNTAASFGLHAFAHHLDGDYQAAADNYRRAFESETDEEKRNQYADSYIEDMSRLGKAVEAWQAVPDPKQAFETLTYCYEEGESHFSDDEFRRITELYQQRFPDSPDGFYYAAQLAIGDDRYEDAEKIISAGLLVADKLKDEEENLSDAASLMSLLGTALSEQGRLAEALQAGDDRKQRFSELARVANYKKRYDDLRKLVDLYRPLEPDDPNIHFYEAEIAISEKRWDDALRELKQAPLDARENWMFQNRLPEVYFLMGKSLEFYAESDEKEEAFSSLARVLIAEKQWEVLDALVVEHQQQLPTDPQISKLLADAAWAQKSYRTFIRYASEVLAQPTSAKFSDYERHAMEDQLFKAYLRSKDFQQARKLAAERQKRDFESLHVAIVDAAIGDFAAARQTALEIAKEDETAAQFYADEDVGHVFLSSVFDELHEQYPVNNFYEITTTGVVFVAAEPWKLTAEELAASAERNGVTTVAPITAVRSVKPTVTAAFVIPLAGANIWVATGTGQFDPNWEFHDDTQALAKTVKGSPHWLAWGTAGWNRAGRDEIAQSMRNLAAESAAGKAQAIVAKEPQAWAQYRVYSNDPEHLELWRLAGDLETISDEGLDVVTEYAETSVATDRQFDNKLREVAGRFKSTPGTDLELLVNVNYELGLGPLRLQVTDVNRKFDSQEFVGQLMVNSELIPELRQGLPIAVRTDQINAWQLEAEPAVFRPK